MNGNTKLRVAVGVFHDIVKLRDVMAGLAGIGCLESDVVVLCDPGAMGGELPKALRAMAAGRKICILIRDTDAVSGIRPICEDNPRSSLTRDQILHFETWIDAHFADGLEHQLKQGGCLLLCPVFSAVSEQSVSRVLLQHSVDSVQLHDIRATD